MKYSILLIACFNFFVLSAQKSKIITYNTEIKFGDESVNALIKEVESERDDIDSLKKIQMHELTKGIFDMVNAETFSHTQVWRDGDWVITREIDRAEGKIAKHYHVNTLEFMVIDSFIYRVIPRIDTFKTSMNYKVNKDWQIRYDVKKTKQRKNILGYSCRLFIIKENKVIHEDGPEERTFSIWATKEMKPAISAHALLGLYQKLMEKYTPLEIEKTSNKMPGGFQRLTAIDIR